MEYFGNVCMYACLYVCMYVWMHVCMYVCKFVCMYIYGGIPLLCAVVMISVLLWCLHTTVCMHACMYVCMWFIGLVALIDGDCDEVGAVRMMLSSLLTIHLIILFIIKIVFTLRYIIHTYLITPAWYIHTPPVSVASLGEAYTSYIHTYIHIYIHT